MPALDGLRGIAILLVIWYHVGLAGGRFDTLPARLFSLGANAGWVGVQLFFVLSGFLITGILLDTRGTPHAWRNFIARRSLRIFPLYYALLAVTFVVLPALGALPEWLEADRAAQGWYWSYLSNWAQPFYIGGPGLAHLWSLAVEEQFYLLWPLLALRLPARRLAVAALAMIGVAIAARLALPFLIDPRKVGERTAYFFTVARWDALAVGALVAIALRDDQWAARVLRRRRAAGMVALLAVLAIAVAGRGLGDGSKPVETIGHTVLALWFATWITTAAVAPAGARGMLGLLAHPALRTIGKYSYAIYLFHLPVAHLLRGALPEGLDGIGGVQLVGVLSLQMLLVFVSSFALALVSWHLLEAPMLRLKRHFAPTAIAARPAPPPMDDAGERAHA